MKADVEEVRQEVRKRFHLLWRNQRLTSAKKKKGRNGMSVERGGSGRNEFKGVAHRGRGRETLGHQIRVPVFWGELGRLPVRGRVQY